MFVHNISLLSEDRVIEIIENIGIFKTITVPLFDLFKLPEKLPVTYLACKAASRSFLCQYVFPLCDCKTGDLYLPSQETCQEVSTVTCRTLWPLLEQLIQPLKLPDCLALPKATYPPGIYMYTVI